MRYGCGAEGVHRWCGIAKKKGKKIRTARTKTTTPPAKKIGFRTWVGGVGWGGSLQPPYI